MALGLDGAALRSARAPVGRGLGAVVHGKETIEARHRARLFRPGGLRRIRPLLQLEDDQGLLRRLPRLPDLRLRDGQGRFGAGRKITQPLLGLSGERAAIPRASMATCSRCGKAVMRPTPGAAPSLRPYVRKKPRTRPTGGTSCGISAIVSSRRPRIYGTRRVCAISLGCTGRTLSTGTSYHRGGLAGQGDELDLAPCARVVDHDNPAHIASLQPMLREGRGQDHGVKFFDH